jgi:putative salt-induced outer membrane protein
MRASVGGLLACSTFLFAWTASAQEPPSAPRGAPPPDAKVLVEAPKSPGEAPKLERPVDGTTVSLAAGGLLTSGNSRLFAFSANGNVESRFDANGLGAAVVANYGEGAPAGQGVQVSTENIQGRLRYDRYVIEQASLFLIATGRHDRFQGVDLRFNLDPGFKYLFLREQSNSLWAEAGYDFQYDVRRNANRVVLGDDKMPVLDASGQPTILDKTHVDHSTRLFLGYRRGFNSEVTLTTGIEYLQSVVDSERSRLNFDALLAAKVGGGLAFGVGFSARFDNAPLPGKKDLDTSTTLSLIYAFSDIPAKKECPCPEPAAAPATETPPAPATPAPPPPPPPTSPLPPMDSGPTAPANPPPANPPPPTVP